MKKLVSFLTILMILFFTSALADPSGTWVQYHKINMSTRRINTLTLESDGHAFFSSETFTISASESSVFK